MPIAGGMAIVAAIALVVAALRTEAGALLGIMSAPALVWLAACFLGPAHAIVAIQRLDKADRLRRERDGTEGAVPSPAERSRRLVRRVGLGLAVWLVVVALSAAVGGLVVLVALSGGGFRRLGDD